MNRGSPIFFASDTPFEVEVNGTSADRSRAAALISALESLAPSERRDLQRSVALPLNYSVDAEAGEGGRLKSVTLDPAWSASRLSLRQPPNEWAALGAESLLLEAAIDAVDMWARLMALGFNIAELPPGIRQVFDGRPRTLVGQGSWSTSAAPWGGALTLPTRASAARAARTLGRVIEPMGDGLPDRAVRMIADVDWSMKAEPPDRVLERLRELGEDLRQCRSQQAIERVLMSRLADGAARLLERETGTHPDVSAKILGNEVLETLLTQRNVERSIEAKQGRERSQAERTSRMVASRATQSFYLDLIPEGQGSLGAPEPLDFDRRFVEGDSAWVVRQVERGDVDLSDVRFAATTRVAAEEQLALLEPPEVTVIGQRWHSSLGLFIVTVGVESQPGVRTTSARFSYWHTGRERSTLVDLVQADGSLTRSAKLGFQLEPDSTVVVAAQWVWRQGGVEAAGPIAGEKRFLVKNRPSTGGEFYGRVSGKDEDVEAVKSARRAVLRIGVSALALLMVALGAYVWGDDVVRSLFGVALAGPTGVRTNVPELHGWPVKGREENWYVRSS